MAINRITGMASGLDVDQLVKDLMKVERSRVDKLDQRKQLIEWKRDLYREINTKVLALRTEAMNMKLSTSYKVFSATASDTSVLSATATASAIEGTYKVTVDQLATATQRKSYDATPENALVSPDLKSSDLDPIDFSVPLDLRGKDLKLTFNGVQKTISWSATDDPTYANLGELITGLQQKIDNVFGTNQIEVAAGVGNQLVLKPKDSTFKPNIVVNTGTNDALAQLKFTNGQQYHISLDTKLQDLKFRSGVLTFESDKADFTINGVRFQIDKTKTLGELISTVNADTNADVTMSYDTTLDKFTIKRDSTGAGATLNVQNHGASDFLTRIKVTDAAALTPGQNAIIDFTDPNNVTMTNLEMSSNTFTLNGVSMTLLKEDAAQKTITVTKDVDKIYDNIKNFIDKYNETIELIAAEYSEERYRDYQPLTDEEREAMSEDQIKLWEDKAKSGLLKGDSILGSIMNDLRSSISNAVTGIDTSYNQITDLGIKTGSYYENGKLYINETKLKEAISSRLNDVTNFFSYSPTNLQSSTLSGVLDVNGKDFKLTLNGIQQTITLSGTYDMSNSTDVQTLTKEIQTKINTDFGTGQISVSIYDSKIILASNKGYTLKLNSGTVDALATLGFNDNDTYDSTKKGIVAKAYDKLVISTSRLVDKAGSSTSYFDVSTLGKELTRLDLDISKQEDRLAEIEDRYYKQFTAMETALNRMNSQSAWLSQQLGGN